MLMGASKNILQILSIFIPMKNASWVLTLLLLSSCYSVERNCLYFHEGRFRFISLVAGEMQESIFERKGNIEIEEYKGKKDSATIRWVNDCECILTKLNPINNQDKRPIQMKILRTKDSTSYTFEYALVGDAKNKRRGTIEKSINTSLLSPKSLSASIALTFLGSSWVYATYFSSLFYPTNLMRKVQSKSYESG